MFGANCSVIGGDHKYNDPSENMRFTSKLGENKDIIIEEDSWIGHGTVILKNAFIAEGCIIGANSLVNSSLKPYSVYAGQPAHFIKPRFKSWDDLSIYLYMMKDRFGFESNYNKRCIQTD
jgi:acetyltransferase-like isoleucine patch superfamily enzyme